MKREQFVDTAIKFLNATVFSKADENYQWIANFLFALGKKSINEWLEPKMAALMKIGAVSESGDVDIDNLASALNEAFTVRPIFKVDFSKIVPLLDFDATFTQADAATLVNMLRNAESQAAKPF